MSDNLIPIPWASGYFVDLSEGEIWSSRARNGQAAVLRKLIGGLDSKGYRHHSIMLGGVQKTIAAHRVIAEVAFGPCPVGMECCHINGDPSDNRSANLKWATRSENNGADKIRHGRLAIGVRHGNAVLDDERVKSARDRRKSGETCAAIAKDMGVSMNTIWRICEGKAWSHI